MKPYGLMFSLLLSMVFYTCVEVIEFETERTAGQIVVDGSIVTGTGSFELYLGTTASANRKTIPLEGAEITLFNDQGNFEVYREIGEGKYLLPGNTLHPEIGDTYFIRIELAGGQVYESERETIPPVSGRLDSLSFGFGLMEELNEYGRITTIPVVYAFADITLIPGVAQNSFLRVDVEEVYRLSPTDFPDPFGSIPPPCYIYTQPDLSTFELLDFSGDEARSITDLKVATARLDYRFDEKHVFNVYLRHLTENAYTFWSQVDQTTSVVGTIFDTPPAPIRGNIYNVNNPEELILGYFGAMSSDTIRAFLIPSYTPYLPHYPCRYGPAKNEYPTRCYDCLSVPGATYQKPDYF